MDSHTIDFHYRYELNNGSYIQLHLRECRLSSI
ncbi:MAG: hypothetical protein DIZ80_03385 [endosymbiont of Galathealinum brachiosum]|uniref:Uncharacterized protein n=1 Tax=endosymbiont of Galathealinum brachiosum TaxID=2200906 RepID=A0A370DKX2_9GAMM|nr:MAG: hypothetical protein DIZ80_03385 [endosymbiont of Galathealinum brachiosum]